MYSRIMSGRFRHVLAVALVVFGCSDKSSAGGQGSAAASGTGPPPKASEVGQRLRGPTIECARAAGIKLKDGQQSWQFDVTIEPSGKVLKVAPPADAEPTIVDCAVLAMRGQTFTPFAGDTVERTVTVTITDTAQMPQPKIPGL